MAKIRTLKDKHLVGGMCDTQIYPETSTSAVYSTDKYCNPIDGVEYVLEDRLQDIEQNAEELQSEIEEVRSSIENCDCQSLTEDEVSSILGTGGTSGYDCNCDCNVIASNNVKSILND